MKLKATFNNGVPSVAYSTAIDGFLPVELVVGKGGKTSRQKALSMYLQTIDYAFRGVSNRVTGDIDEISVEKSWSGSVYKDGDSVVWNCVVDKTFIIIYDITSNGVTEKMYVADGLAVSDGKNVKPLWQNELMKATKDEVKRTILASISIFSEYIDKYQLVWGVNGNKVSLLNTSGKEISIEDVPEDDIYTLLKLINVLMLKSTHMGVYFINCLGFSDKVLNALIKLVQEIYGDTFVFLYNCSPNCTVKKEVINLPNFVIKEGVTA